MHKPPVTILGIETSCDETAASVVCSDKNILSNVVFSQREHDVYGGVVPEIASRAHITHIDSVINTALKDSKKTLADIDAIAVTAGPGLIGGVIVGVMTAKALASATKKPLIAVNHLEGHALSARLCTNVEFPYLLMLLSGGHCQLLVVKAVGVYELLGETLDDALGEAFDKVAKMLGIGMPGGPAVENLAKKGDMNSIKFPIPLARQAGCDFSFSGLKTAVRQYISANSPLNEIQKSDICASFQKATGTSVCERLHNALTLCENKKTAVSSVVVAGGVAANEYIKTELVKTASGFGLELIAPPANLCTDNAAMIAWAGIEHYQLGNSDELNIEPKARWPLA